MMGAPYPSGASVAAQCDDHEAAVEREAGRLALRLSELAAEGLPPVMLAERVLALLCEALGMSAGALFASDAPRGSGSPRVVTTVGQAEQTLPRDDARRALAEGRLLLLAATPAAQAPTSAPQRGVMLPIGAPTPFAVLGLGWPRGRTASDDGGRVSLLLQLAPVLALVLRSPLGADHPSSEAPINLLALMAHELRTPLNTINGFVEIVLDGLAGPLSERQREFLTYAHRSTHQLTRLIEDMLLLGMDDGRRALLHLALVPLSEPLRSALTAARDVARERNVTLDVAPLPTLPCLRLDERRLERACEHVLNFALARAPADGVVTVDVTCGPREVTVTVHDAGQPIAGAAHAHRFEPQRPAPGTATTGASGLELAVARLIVVRHGGTLTARSDAVGATLSLTLPVASDGS